MSEPRPLVSRFARAIVRAELARGGGAHDSDVAQRTMVRLYQELGKLIGPTGFDVLLARSLVLARRAHPVVAEVVAGPGGTLVGLDAATLDAAALQEGSIAIVSHFIELLVTLIGEDLGMTLVGDIWPVALEEEKK